MMTVFSFLGELLLKILSKDIGVIVQQVFNNSQEIHFASIVHII